MSINFRYLIFLTFLLSIVRAFDINQKPTELTKDQARVKVQTKTKNQLLSMAMHNKFNAQMKLKNITDEGWIYVKRVKAFV